MKKFINTFIFCLFSIFIYACGGGNLPGTVYVNESQKIQENTYVTYQLKSGSYKAEITSSNYGVIVEWIGGANCQKSSETKVYSNSCTLTQPGQLKIANPTILGLGGDEIVTIKITSI